MIRRPACGERRGIRRNRVGGRCAATAGIRTEQKSGGDDCCRTAPVESAGNGGESLLRRRPPLLLLGGVVLAIGPEASSGRPGRPSPLPHRSAALDDATILSPGFSQICSGRTLRDMPVPAGLPEAMTSPGNIVRIDVLYSIRS